MENDKPFSLVGWDPSATQLSLRHAPDGRRYHTLDDQPLQRGQMVELLMPRGSWLRGTYEWDQDLDATSYDPQRRPLFVAILGGPWEANDAFDAPRVRFALPPEAVLRHVRFRRPRRDRGTPRRSR